MHKLNDDGTIPTNEYGNYEIMTGEMPPGIDWPPIIFNYLKIGCIHIDLPGLKRLCK